MTEYSPIQRTLRIQWTRRLDGTWEPDVYLEWGVSTPEETRWLVDRLRAVAHDIQRDAAREAAADRRRSIQKATTLVARAWPKCPADPAHTVAHRPGELEPGSVTVPVWWCVECKNHLGSIRNQRIAEIVERNERRCTVCGDAAAVAIADGDPRYMPTHCVPCAIEAGRGLPV